MKHRVRSITGSNTTPVRTVDLVKEHDETIHAKDIGVGAEQCTSVGMIGECATRVAYNQPTNQPRNQLTN